MHRVGICISARLSLVATLLLLAAMPAIAATNPPGSPELLPGQARLICVGTTLSWYSSLPGDYNSDGLVDITDITPIGQHYGKTHPLGCFFFADILAGVDGDGNGEINQADLTEIGRNYGLSALGGYRVYHSASLDDYPVDAVGPNGPGAELLGQGAGGEVLGATLRTRWQFELSSFVATDYYWVRPVSETGVEGTASTFCTYVGGVAPSQSENAAPLTYQPANNALVWSYVNIGDFDQNGELSIADFTVLGMYFNQSGPFDFSSGQSLLDSNSDSLISLQDLNPWAVYFRQSVVEYKVFRSATLDGYPQTPTAPADDDLVIETAPLWNTVIMGPGPAERMRFEFEMLEPAGPYYYWVRPYDQYGNPGVPSNWVQVP